MSKWSIYIEDSGGSWVADTAINRPNEDLILNRTSTQTKVNLANGDEAYITPSTKYRKEPMKLVWLYDDGTIKSQIEGYVENQDYIKITDHNAVDYIGRFISVNSTWLVGVDTDKYDVEAMFEVQE